MSKLDRKRRTCLVKMDAAKFNMALARAGKSVKQVAIDAGIDRVTVFNAGLGRGVRPETLGRIASALSVDVSEILADAGGGRGDEKSLQETAERRFE
ncbi:MAG: hypothetical protein HDT16_03540 [Oscillibacter sp.]|nr:hypothetical protein [Oscillibacter sp.]